MVTMYPLFKLQTLKNLLQNPDILREVLSSHAQSSSCITDICDGYFVKEHLPETNTDIPLLHLVAYYDGVEVANPLGTKTKKHNIYLFYCMLGNIHPSKRSVYQTIFLVAICKTKHLKKHGVRSMLQPFIHDLQVLNSADGCSVEIDGTTMNFRAVLVAFCGDTPASNYIGGFKEGLGGAYRGCRECIATKPEMETMLLHEECPLRDETSHTQQCRSLENLTGKEFAEASKISGVNFLSPLHDVPHFQVTKCFPQDAMHVLLEGVVPHEFTLFLRYALDKK